MKGTRRYEEKKDVGEVIYKGLEQLGKIWWLPVSIQPSRRNFNQLPNIYNGNNLLEYKGHEQPEDEKNTEKED